MESLKGWADALRGQAATMEAHRGRVEVDPRVDQNQQLSPELGSLLDQGGPLIVESINKINAASQELARTLAVGLASFVGVNAYISPPSSCDLPFFAKGPVETKAKRGLMNLRWGRQGLGWRYADPYLEGVSDQRLFGVFGCPSVGLEQFSSFGLHREQ